MATRIKEKYLTEAVPALQQKFGYKNVMQIPRLEKIVTSGTKVSAFPDGRRRKPRTM